MMKIAKKLCGTALLATTLVLSSCASYKAVSLNTNLTPEYVPQGAEVPEIAIGAKAFSKYDCKMYLDRDVLSEGYQPVQLTIQNNSKRTLQFIMNGLSLPHVPAEHVAQTVHTSTIGRIVGYSVGSLLLWPLIIPAIVDGIKSSEANKQLDHDFIAKSAKDQILYPHGRMNGLVFVPLRDFTDSFTVSLVDKETNHVEQIYVKLPQ